MSCPVLESLSIAVAAVEALPVPMGLGAEVVLTEQVAAGGRTDLDSMVSLCWVHHRMTELGKFRFIARRAGEPRPAGSLEHQRWWIIPPAPASTSR